MLHDIISGELGNPYTTRRGVVGKVITSLYKKHIMHGHTVRSAFFFFFFFFGGGGVFLSYDKGRDTYICFLGHIMRVRFKLFIYLYVPLAQSNLFYRATASLTSSYTWIEGIHIFNSFSSHLLLWVYGWLFFYEHWNIWLVVLDSISVYIGPSPVSPERSPGSSVKRCPAKLVGGQVVRWSLVNFQGRGVLLIWIMVWQGPIALAVGAGGGCLDILTLLYLFTLLSLSLSLSLWRRPAMD